MSGPPAVHHLPPAACKESVTLYWRAIAQPVAAALRAPFAGADLYLAPGRAEGDNLAGYTPKFSLKRTDGWADHLPPLQF